MNSGLRSRSVVTVIIGAILVAIALASQPVRASGPWYVAPGGGDSNGCLDVDDACATIEGALAKADAGDTIYVATGTYIGDGDQVVRLAQDVTLSGGWNQAFTVQSGVSTIDGEGSRAGITVEQGVTVTVERFVIQHGTGSSSYLWREGGGIHNKGTLYLDHCTIRYNSNQYYGGGIYNDSPGVMTINCSSITHNTVMLPQGGGSGGGIGNDGELILNDSIISNNTVNYQGGGIASTNHRITLNNSVVSHNAAGHIGGGICNYVTLTLNDSTVHDNTAGQNGGGIYQSSLLATLALNNSTLAHNTADGNGGGIYLASGMLKLNSSTIYGNTAGQQGGGVSRHDGAATLQNTLLAGNMSSVSPNCYGAIDSLGYNLVGNTSGCDFAESTGDLLNVNAGLFPLLFGSPGFYPLSPDSLAIDAANPSGCTDHLGNPLTTDQRGAARSLDGDNDGSAVCDIGAYEFDPAAPITVTQVFLPAAGRSFCADFFDDFSDPTSGWPVGEDGYVRSEYLNGEYRILTKQAGYLYLFKAPTCGRQDYVVEVDVRWVGSPGSSYGLVFGITANFDQYYLFDMNTDYRQFRLLRRDSGGFTAIVPPTGSMAINGGTANNHLRVTRNGGQMTLEVNGVVLGIWNDSAVVGATGAGIVSSPYSSNPSSDARFDNFSVGNWSESSVSVHGPGEMLAFPHGNSVPDAYRREVLADIEW